MKKNKLAILFVSLMTFSGCEVYIANSSSSNTTSNQSNVSTSTIIESSSISSSTLENSSINSSSTSSSSSESSSSSSSSSSESNSSSSNSSSSSSDVSSSTNSDSSSSSENTQTKFVQACTINLNYDSYLTSRNHETVNAQDSFKDLTQIYKVGDDNSVSFMPVLTSLVNSDFSNPITTIETEWNFSVTMKKLNVTSNEYELVTASDYYDNFDSTKCIFDFNDNAIGNTFKIDVVPNGLTSGQLSEVNEYTVTYEFSVVDGYNVTSAKELAYISNDNNNMPEIGSLTPENTLSVWNEFKEANGLQLNYYPSKIILHNDINVTNSDIPSEFFYNQEEANMGSDADKALGSLKDRADIYRRNLVGNETFDIEGNYFKIDASEISPIVRYENTVGESTVSHSQLFYFDGGDGNTTSKVTINNMKLIGNAPREENITLAGGLIMNKVDDVQFEINNTISHTWFITYMVEDTKAIYTINNSKAYNNFNSFVYNWGGNVVINNSEMISAGGPVIIQDHVGLKTTETSDDYIPSTVVNNSNLESKVSGSEAWFALVMGSLANTYVANIKFMDYLFNAHGRTFLSTKTGSEGVTYMDLICVNKSGSVESVSSDYNVRGSLQFDGTVPFDYGSSELTSAYGNFYETMIEQSQVPPMFQTNTGGAAFGYMNADSSGNITGGTLKTPSQSDVISGDPILTGDYLCIYFNGMAITLGSYVDYKTA